MNSQQQTKTAKASALTRAPRNADELSFTYRKTPSSPISWWNVEVPDSLLWDDHFQAGRRYGEEYVSYLDNPEQDQPKDDLTGEHHLSAILHEIVRKAPETPEGLYIGFFQVVAERLFSSRIC